MTEIALTVDGVEKTLEVEPRRLLADVPRQAFVYAAEGQPLTSSFADYLMPGGDRFQSLKSTHGGCADMQCPFLTDAGMTDLSSAKDRCRSSGTPQCLVCYWLLYFTIHDQILRLDFVNDHIDDRWIRSNRLVGRLHDLLKHSLLLFRRNAGGNVAIQLRHL